MALTLDKYVGAPPGIPSITCEIGNRQFSAIGALAGHVDLTKIKVTPIDDKKYAGFEYFPKNAMNNPITLAVTYTVMVLKPNALNLISGVLLDLDGIREVGGVGTWLSGRVEAKLLYEVGSGRDFLEVTAVSALTTDKGADAGIKNGAAAIKVVSVMAINTDFSVFRNAGGTFLAVRHRYPK